MMWGGGLYGRPPWLSARLYGSLVLLPVSVASPSLSLMPIWRPSRVPCLVLACIVAWEDQQAIQGLPSMTKTCILQPVSLSLASHLYLCCYIIQIDNPQYSKP